MNFTKFFTLEVLNYQLPLLSRNNKFPFHKLLNKGGRKRKAFKNLKTSQDQMMKRFVSSTIFFLSKTVSA